MKFAYLSRLELLFFEIRKKRRNKRAVCLHRHQRTITYNYPIIKTKDVFEVCTDCGQTLALGAESK